MTQRSSDAPQNLVEFERWRRDKSAYMCDSHYLYQVNKKWRSLGRQAKQPASLRSNPHKA